MCALCDFDKVIGNAATTTLPTKARRVIRAGLCWQVHEDLQHTSRSGRGEVLLGAAIICSRLCEDRETLLGHKEQGRSASAPPMPAAQLSGNLVSDRRYAEIVFSPIQCEKGGPSGTAVFFDLIRMCVLVDRSRRDGLPPFSTRTYDQVGRNVSLASGSLASSVFPAPLVDPGLDRFCTSGRALRHRDPEGVTPSLGPLPERLPEGSGSTIFLFRLRPRQPP